MKKKLRLIATILLISMIFPIFSGIIQPVFAADLQDIKVTYSESTATATISWRAVPNVDNGKLVYHVPNGTGTGVTEVEVPIDITKNSLSITKIKKDIIYDFSLELIDDSGTAYVGNKYFLAGTTVTAANVDQQAEKMDGGGMETGIYPAVKLSWNMPKVYFGGDMVNADAVPAIFNANQIYFKFKIQLDTMLKDVVVKKLSPASSDYKVSIDDGTKYDVKYNSATGKFEFYLLGRKDSDTEIAAMPTPKGIPAGDLGCVLPYQELYPSTIYRISMITIFDEGTGDDSGVVTGITQSPIDLDYICTSVRFQLTKDTLGNLYVRVFRVNQKGIALLNLTYDIQTSYGGSWRPSENVINDRDLGTDPAPIIDIIKGENNPVKYRIVVIENRIQSPVMEYNMQDDLVKPPVPNNILTNVELEYPTSATTVKETSSKVTITWDYPGDELWNQIKDQNYYFHFNLSLAEDPVSSPQKLMVDGQEKFFEIKYRDVKSVNANRIEVDKSGSRPRLKYVMDGYELFKGVENEDLDGDGNWDTFPLPNLEPANAYQGEQPYPNYLLPNKTYYLQMYTSTKEQKDVGYVVGDSFSEKSLITSFTTLSPASRDISIPKFLQLVETTVMPSDSAIPKEASAKIRFDQIKMNDADWKNYTPEPVQGQDAVYYDLYMSTSPDTSTFIKIASTQDPAVTELPDDVKFTVEVDNNNVTWVYATINKFSGINEHFFGGSLAPNSTYYFMVKVRLVMVNSEPKESIKSALLPVTIPRGEPTTPDDSEKKPQAPEDFAIAVDKNGDLMLTGQSVTFEWTIRDSDSAYNLIATSSRVAPDATLAAGGSILSDPTYISFITAFGNKGNDGDGTNLIMNPNIDPLPAKFEIIPGTRPGTSKCRYTIDTWLFPNKVYYFSLRSENEDAGNNIKSSVWISIPVTTTLIESPTMLQVVNDCALAFNWYGTLPAQNYQIRLKPVGEIDYTVLTKSQYTIVQDSRYYNYARTTKDIKLKPDTPYNIQVVTRVNGVESVIDIVKYSSNGYYETRDDYHEIDVRWQGIAMDPYTEFEIAIKTEDDADYTVLDNSEDLEQYVDVSTHTYPYYIEKSINNLSSSYFTYNARIKSVEVTLPDGTKEHKPLKANTKYYIKVRTKKTDAINFEAVARSKYAGPVDTRTEFNQDDYDDEDDNTNITDKFLDMLDKLEENVYWEVDKATGSMNKIYVKDERIVNILESPGNYTFTIDISQSPGYVNSDEIYLAKSVLNAMKSTNKSVIIKTREIEYTIRPETFDLENMEEFKKAAELDRSKDVYLQLDNIQSTGVQPAGPADATAASKMNSLSAQVVASSATSTAIKDMIKNKLYNDKTGIIQKKLDVLKNPNNSKTKGDEQKVNEYLLQLIDEIKSELSYYIEDTINGTGYSNGLFIQKYSITKFSSPMAVKMEYKGSTLANPYVLYSGSGNWQKLSQNIKRETGFLNYVVTGTGKYMIFSGKDVVSAIADDNPAKEYITRLAANYDLASVFPGADNSFNTKLTVTVREAVLFYELISESRVDSQKNVKDKAKVYGIDKIINTTNLNRNITKQETAAVIIKLYCQKTGADYGLLKVSYNKLIKDDSGITDKYAIPVYACLQMDIMSLDSNSKFNPSNTVSRAEFTMAVEKMLES